jgi:hypothetical protein
MTLITAVALIRCVRNETLGARNPKLYHSGTRGALLRRRLATITPEGYLVPTPLGLALVRMVTHS